MQRFRNLFFIFIFLCGSAQAVAADPSSSKLEELFIWKMSDDLGLKAEEERKFSEMVRELDRRKADLNRRMQDGLEKMSAAKTDKEKSSELSQYEKALKDYNAISAEEIVRMRKILGVSRTVQYLQVKKDLTNRLKSLLANPDAGSTPATAKKALPPPKVIEQK